MKKPDFAKQIAAICVTSLKAGNKIMFCGNGGSAADAQHLAAELVGKLNFDRPPLAGLALTDNSSNITAIGNDYGFRHIFSRQIQALGKAGDVLICFTTSGNSINILEAVKTARAKGIITIVLTGTKPGKIIKLRVKGHLNDRLYGCAGGNTQAIQEHHMKLGHAFCGHIERMMFA